MKGKYKSLILWILSVLLMIIVAAYQRMTGPTYPITGKITIKNEIIKFSLPTSHETTEDASVRIIVNDKSLKGYINYKRFKSYDTLTKQELQRSGDTLYTFIPKQIAAGKVEYTIWLEDLKNRKYQLYDEPVIIRYKDPVPLFALIPHVILMFLAMVFSVRTGIEAIRKGPNIFSYTKYTLILLFFGGLIMGPVVQKYAFDAFWTGWPFGHDLTDNKTIVSFIFWLIAFFVTRKNKSNGIWPLIASIVLMAIYLIPHSVLGSEVDYRQIESILSPIFYLV